ncbi:hypothetical protein WJ0W_001275 [Paenibacillus melissococcoides]|uniref:Uncharacterized protein n=1 Tax=Paenibacillus melissococcoides TaxID=2912268 RepID=A0ABM9FXU1_9BACL|nr:MULTISPECIES: hypothetical protein [Paenibacillus]MEB9895748.1 hypothetical protein [Bacillus cereus]CAH8244036.1 hypothetical protein WJ0W_001275 [Paenibacillus melissococcoides]CAH8703984.1 hypothetical protein HTL2_000383 [Paenibacillus melissococcoides]CAH8706635.1 hypothetical protein WDD9_001345 [Paenibacillus melissococcoides]GIO80194.1 hypothetical protein J6TS7_38040 [Paenibacillus dendritiformis]
MGSRGTGYPFRSIHDLIYDVEFYAPAFFMQHLLIAEWERLLSPNWLQAKLRDRCMRIAARLEKRRWRRHWRRRCLAGPRPGRIGLPPQPASAGFDSEAPSFVSWPGVIHYLPRDDAFATLRMLADICPAGSEIVFDYWDTEAFHPDRAAFRVKWMQEMLRYAGEPMLTGLAPSAIAGQLRESGLHLREQLSPEAIQERFFMNRSDGYMHTNTLISSVLRSYSSTMESPHFFSVPGE